MPIEEDPPAGAPEWVVTYGDMMSLLLTFFIMLVSMSKMKEDGTMRAMLDGIREAFGADLGTFGAPGPSQQKTSILNKLGSLGRQSRGGAKKSNPNTKGSGGPGQPVRSMAKGPVISLGGPALFPKFEAQMSPELEKQLERILEVISDKLNRVEVRGHCSPEPLPEGSPFPDMMSLSFERAHLVGKYLLDHGVDPRRILITAAADHEPVRRTANADARQLNDRVDVFLLESYITVPNE